MLVTTTDFHCVPSGAVPAHQRHAPFFDDPDLHGDSDWDLNVLFGVCSSWGCFSLKWPRVCWELALAGQGQHELVALPPVDHPEQRV